MSERVSPRFGSPTWKYALVGGVASIPFTLGLNWLSETGNHYSLNAVFFGGLLAGYLASRASLDAEVVGLRAGVVGSLPALVQAFPRILDTTGDFVAAWSFPPAAVLAIPFGAIVLGLGGVTGLVGGLVGDWLATKIERRRTSVTGT